MSIIKVLNLFLYVLIVSMNEIILLGRALVSIGAWSGYPCSNVLVSEVFIYIDNYLCHTSLLLLLSVNSVYFYTQSLLFWLYALGQSVILKISFYS